MHLLINGLIILIIFSNFSRAEESLSTVPQRDSVQLTIYNSEDLTFVRERRRITFKQGSNQLSFSWANTLIDPSSVQIHPKTGAEKLEVLDTVFPHYSRQMLLWNVQAEAAGQYEIEISYFTSGIRWDADYVAIVGADEKYLALTGYVRVTNGSGENYENAQIRLVVGQIHLVEEIRRLAEGMADEKQRGEFLKNGMKKEVRERIGQFDSLANAAPQSSTPKDIIKEGLSEYYIYTIEGTETVANGWTKRLRSFQAFEVTFETVFRHNAPKYGAGFACFVVFKNDEAHKLGKEPLPNGMIRFYQQRGDALSYLGAQSLEYIPNRAKVEINLGVENQMSLELLSWNLRKTDLVFENRGLVGWTTIEDRQLKVKNFLNKPAKIEVEQIFSGDFDFSSEISVEKINFSTVKFTQVIQPGKELLVPYTLTTRQGKNARK